MGVLSSVGETKFAELFSQRPNIYILPNYQRPYAWDSKNIDDFINDIYLNFSKRKDNPYLFGNIFLAPVTTYSDLKNFIHSKVYESIFFHIEKFFQGEVELQNLTNKNHNELNFYLIIDGQQRMTTFFMLLHLLSEYNNTIKFSMYETLQKPNIQIPKLILTKLDYKYFLDLLENKNPIRESLSHSRLYEAKRKLEEFLKKDELYKREDFITYILNKLVIVESVISDLKYAVILFVSQTDRGKELSYIEKLKSLFNFYAYSKLPNCEGFKLAQKIDNIFSDLFETLDKAIKNGLFKDEKDFEELLFKALLIYNDVDHNKDLYSTFRSLGNVHKIYNIFNDNLKQTSSWVEYIEYLLNIINNFNCIIKKILENLKDKKVKTIFLDLKPNPKTWIILLLLQKKFPDFQFDLQFEWNIIESKFLKEIKNELEIESRNLKTISNLFLNRKISSLEKRINNLLNKKSIKIDILDLIEFIDLSIWKVSKEPHQKLKTAWNKAKEADDLQEFLLSFHNLVEEYRSKHYLEFSKLNEYILCKIERLYHNNDFEAITIEHLFPRRLEDSQKHLLPKYGFKDIDEYENFKERLGNLFLMEKTINQKLGNLFPDEKIEKLKNEGFLAELKFIESKEYLEFIGQVLGSSNKYIKKLKNLLIFREIDLKTKFLELSFGREKN